MVSSGPSSLSDAAGAAISSITATRSLGFEQFACWLMSAVCGGGGVYGYMQRASLPSLIAGLGFGAAFGYSGHLIRSGRNLDGIDLSILASFVLLVAMGPRAYRTRAPVPIALSTGSGLVLARMGYMSYLLRHGQ